MNSKLLLTVLPLLITVSPKITLESNLQSSEITLKDIHSFSQVLVEAQFNYIDNERYEKVHLVVRAAHKHKKQAYIDLIRKYNGVVRGLVKMKAIPNKDSMIQSIIHRNFLRKSRKWEFSRYFVVYGLVEEIPKVLQKLQVFRPEIVKTSPIVHYLDEKFISIAAFLQAKLQLQKFIKDHLNSQYKILQTKDLEIIGDKVKNEDLIQHQIQKQFNPNPNPRSPTESASEQASAAREIEGFYSNTAQVTPKKIVMKVLFQLVEKSADMEDVIGEIEDGEMESHSISDFQSQVREEYWGDEDDGKGRDKDDIEVDGDREGDSL